MRFCLLGAVVALVATATNAQTSTYCPGSEKVCYTVNVPSNGATSSIFFQISGPSTMSWIALGQGSRMTGANIFVIYANAAGTNVTLSSRLGTGEEQPKSDTTARLALLDGSGIMNGMMVANVKCTNCQRWSGGTMDFTSSSASWIYAYKIGDPVMSDSASANIVQHDDHGPFTFNLANAASGDGSLNPFTTTTSATIGGIPGANGFNNTGSSSAPLDKTEQMVMTATTAHGIMGAAAFIVLFPSGSIVMRAFNFHGVLWVHVVIQLLGYATALALMETGVWIAVNNGKLMNAHPLIGFIVVCGLFFQPFLGLAHHLLYKKQGGPNAFTGVHVWWGRVLVTLGIINGGLGLQLAGNSRGIYVAYGTVAGIVWSVWMGLAALTWWRAYAEKRAEREHANFKPRIVRLMDSESTASSAEMLNFSGHTRRDGLPRRDWGY